VSEPAAEEDDEDCAEIGYAYVDLCEILQTGRDLIGAEVPSQQLCSDFFVISFVIFIVIILGCKCCAQNCFCQCLQ